MTRHFKTYKHHYLKLCLVVFTALTTYLLALFVFANVDNVGVSHAATYDSTVRIIITGGYQGSATATTVGHSIGTCTSKEYQPFTIQAGTYTYCNGIAMGSPDGMQLYLTKAPSGFRVTGWRTTYNGTDGRVDCSGSSCWLNFTQGQAFIEVQIDPISPPQPPHVTLSGVTANSMSVYWDAGDPASTTFYDYLPYLNGNNGGATQARSMTYSGLTCGKTYSFYVVMRTSGGNYNSNTVYATTSACAPPPSSAPAPAPSAPSSGSGSGGETQPSSTQPIQGSTSSKSTGSSKTSGSTTQSTASAVTSTPPSSPEDFRATANKGNSTISLSWRDSQSTSLVTYTLERSADNTIWHVIDRGITRTSYSDTTTDFSTHYYYRLTAKDANDLSSSAVTTEVTSAAFAANSGQGKDVELATKDGYVHIIIPSGALQKPANCAIADEANVPLTGGSGLQIIGGPYQIICQQEDAVIVRSFRKPLAVNITMPDRLLKKYKHFQYRAYSSDEGTWKTLEARSDATKYELTSSQVALTILAQEKHFPKWVVVLIVVLVVVGGGVVGLAYIGRVRQRRRLEAIARDYWHKTNGI